MRNSVLYLMASLIFPVAVAPVVAAQIPPKPAPRTAISLRTPAPMLPFYSESKSTHVQVLANGVNITTESTSGQARDGQGRYYDFNSQPSVGGQPAITNFHISDKIAGTEIRWDSRKKKVTVVQLPPEEQRHGCWQSDSGRLNWSYPLTPEQRAAKKASEMLQAPVPHQSSIETKKENLGTDTFQGLLIRGFRVTRTTPTGEVGNDQPLVSTSESWTSDEYRLEARYISDDPREGRFTRELTSFVPGEPDPALFQPPQGFPIVAEQTHEVPCNQ